MVFPLASRHRRTPYWLPVPIIPLEMSGKEQVHVKFQQEKNVLVVVGGWNPQIVLNPTWLKKFLFPEQKEFKVEFQVGPGQLPTLCVTASNLKISLPGSRLCFSQTGNEGPKFGMIQTVAYKLADFLPHTPVSAYGVNFVFETDIGKRSFMNQDTVLYKALTESGKTITEEHSRYSMSYGGALLNITARETTAETGSKSLELDFNFHRAINDLALLKAGLDETSIDEYFAYANDFAQQMQARITEAQEAL